MVRSSFAAPGFRNSLFDDDDTAPVTFGRPGPSLLSADVGPGAVNRRADVDRVESLLTRTAVIAPKATAARGLYDAPVETGLRDFQAGRGLKVDGLLKPGGPTERALRAQADQLAGQAPEPRRPGLKGLDGAAVAENARAVAHLAATRADGLYPDLLTETARGSRAGRSQVADFFAQLMRADHARAGQLRAKMTLAPDEDRRLFREIDQVLAADAFEDGRRRLAESVLPLGDADDNDDDGGIGTPPDEGGGGGGDEPPAYDPAHPQPGDPDDPDEPEKPDEPNEPNEPNEPEKPKPPEKPKEDCSIIERGLEQVISELDAVIDEKRETQGTIAEAEARIALLEDERVNDVLPQTPPVLGRVPRLQRRKLKPSPQDLIDFLGQLTFSKDYMDRVAAERARKARIDAQITEQHKIISALREKLKELAKQESQKRKLMAEYARRLRACRERNG